MIVTLAVIALIALIAIGIRQGAAEDAARAARFAALDAVAAGVRAAHAAHMAAADAAIEDATRMADFAEAVATARAYELFVASGEPLTLEGQYVYHSPMAAVKAARKFEAQGFAVRMSSARVEDLWGIEGDDEVITLDVEEAA